MQKYVTIKMKLNKPKITIAVLVILLALSISYIGIGIYNKVKQEEQLEVFQQGAQYGYEQAVIQIAGMAMSCEQVPLKVENQTINMIAVDCLQ